MLHIAWHVNVAYNGVGVIACNLTGFVGLGIHGEIKNSLAELLVGRRHEFLFPDSLKVLPAWCVSVGF